MTLVALPEVSTTTAFKERVEQTCEMYHLDYDTVVTRLLEEWMDGHIPLEIEPDPDFVASAREAFHSESVRHTLHKLNEDYDPKRIYAKAKKVS
ncbi:MAG: hypothetical protein GY801_11540 [bacterium]|nr:hypothetical protein [bacterium]